MKTNLPSFLHVVLTVTCLRPILTSENDFFKHLLRNLKNDILNLKPGSNKTYIINSKLLGRNDSIELDIKSRAKGINEELHKMHESEVRNHIHGRVHKEVNEYHGHLRDHKQREELRHKIRAAMQKEIAEIQENHNLQIRKVRKHKAHAEGRQRIRIKVLKKRKTDVTTEPVTDVVEQKAEAKSKAKKVKSIKILHLPVLRKLKKVHRGRRIANGKSELENSFGSDSAFEEGGQIPELFCGEDFHQDQISEMFRNTKDLEVHYVTSTPTTTTTTTTEATTKNVKDEYTYEYVYEDELEKGKGIFKKDKDKNKESKKKGATDDDYTYEYIYEDEMNKEKATTPATTTTKATTTPMTTETILVEETEETEEQASKIHEAVKLSPSVEKEVNDLREMEANISTTTVATDEYFGDSNSQYKQPERFMYESEHQPQDDSQYPEEYDWNAPPRTTAAQTYRIAASSIMYDDEDTQEFLAQRNKTKQDRGYDSYPADQIFTCDIRDLRYRYTRPKLTPHWYDSIDEYIDHWGGRYEDRHQGDPTAKHRRNKTSMRPIGRTVPYNATHRQKRHNATVDERMQYKIDLEKLIKNSTNLWMKNITHTTPYDDYNDVEDDVNGIHVPEYMPHVPQYVTQEKIRRIKRDIGGGMKLPRVQWEVLMYLAMKKNRTRWIARLKKLRAAPNLMEMLIKRSKRKQNKNGIVYKQKAIKPKKRPKGHKRVMQKKRKPKENRKALRVKLAANRRRKKEQRKKRSVDNLELVEERQSYIDIGAYEEKVERSKRDAGNGEDKPLRKNKKVDKLSDDLLYDFEQNPEKMQGTIRNMTEVYQANLLETHKMSLDKAMDMAIEKIDSAKNISAFNKTDEIAVYRIFICEYKQLMEEWFISMFFDVPNAMRRYAKKHIYKLRKDRPPSNTQINKYFEYDNLLTIRLEMAERVIRTTMKHFYDEMEDKVFGYFYGFEKAEKLFEDPYKNINRTTLSDRDLMRLLVQTTEYDPDIKREEVREARQRLVGPTDRYGNTLRPLPDLRWK